MKKRITLITIVLSITICGLLCACGSKSINASAEQTQANQDSVEKITVKVKVSNDLIDPKTNESKDYEVTYKTLGELVRNTDIFEWEDGPYGALILGVCGAKQDEANGIYWMFQVNGEDSMVGVDEVEIHDGDEYMFYTAQY